MNDRDVMISRMQQSVSQETVDVRPKVSEKQKPLSIDDVMEKISDIAGDRDNRDQFKALKMLAAAKSSSVVLPEPLSDGEVIERLFRLMRPAGMDLCQIAYRKAFQGRMSNIEDKPTLLIGDLSDEMKAQVKKVTSLKVFYKVFPEMKAPGIPKGYPSGKGMERQRGWLQRMSAKILLDREQANLDAVVKTDQEIIGATEETELRSDDPSGT